MPLEHEKARYRTKHLSLKARIPRVHVERHHQRARNVPSSWPEHVRGQRIGSLVHNLYSRSPGEHAGGKITSRFVAAVLTVVFADRQSHPHRILLHFCKITLSSPCAPHHPHHPSSILITLSRSSSPFLDPHHPSSILITLPRSYQSSDCLFCLSG